jgi:hypothetical protein
MLWSAGCTVIEGATGPPGAATLSFAPPLVALPAKLLTTTAKVTPLSAVVAAGVV